MLDHALEKIKDFRQELITFQVIKSKSRASSIPGQGLGEEFWYWFTCSCMNILGWIVHQRFTNLSSLKMTQNYVKTQVFFGKCGSQHSFCTKEAHDEYEKWSLKLAGVVEMKFRYPQKHEELSLQNFENLKFSGDSFLVWHAITVTVQIKVAFSKQFHELYM